ncbi:AraC family transcriptional regulator [Spiractinospora alimapuensis]|uniref:AraC family transcriptional regulator n=1 Tax=Spiractinospora alimapuensis TaxID=2820884 RepID=UPI001F2362DB|nr:helix-turn-helix domain-containing protein [Spiractinospora alimapuensis]QVQ54159.1 AraC family transcriptional regulator [Spiractinospora alimapuensis]
MVDERNDWTLERNDRRIVFASGADATVFAESTAFRVTRHALPVWKVVLPIGGDVEVGGRGPAAAAPGVVVPPGFAHDCGTVSPYLAVFLDPWHLAPDTRTRLLDRRVVRRLLAALGDIGEHGPEGILDLAAVRAELEAVAGVGSAPDPRVRHALRAASRPGAGGNLRSVAAEVGVSAPRLRALAREGAGVPLVRLRRWARLRSAVAALPGRSIAEAAAEAGFADQAHFARTARGMLGRAPSSVLAGAGLARANAGIDLSDPPACSAEHRCERIPGFGFPIIEDWS